jgi:hypothetical protein
MSRTIPVFVNAARVDARDDATALDAVRALDAAAADEVAQGTRIITDSRGLPVPPDTRLHAGAIFRLVAARDREALAGSDEP